MGSPGAHFGSKLRSTKGFRVFKEDLNDARHVVVLMFTGTHGCTVLLVYLEFFCSNGTFRGTETKRCTAGL